MTSISANRPVAQPTTLSISTSLLWMAAMIIVGLLLYYFVGFEQGAISILGNEVQTHEFAHDARHVLGFPCH